MPTIPKVGFGRCRQDQFRDFLGFREFKVSLGARRSLQKTRIKTFKTFLIPLYREVEAA